MNVFFFAPNSNIYLSYSDKNQGMVKLDKKCLLLLHGNQTGYQSCELNAKALTNVRLIRLRRNLLLRVHST